MKIAIIGSGISGLTSAYLLNRRHDITVFEAGSWVGGHTHTVDVSVAGETHAVTLTLQDDAGGLTSEQLSQPFAPFRSSKSEGLGLGLVICQRLINSQGGNLTLRNQVATNGHIGLHVIVTLPLNPSKELSFVTDSLG